MVAILAVAGLAALGHSRWPEVVNPTGDLPTISGAKVVLEAAPAIPSTLSADEALPIFPAGQGERRQAERDLLGLWGIEAADGEEICGTAQAAGLECLENIGSLALLGLLDRPAILRLHTLEGESFHASLVGLEGETVSLMIAGQIHKLPIVELERYWLGEFTLLWRPMLPAAIVIRRGDQGAPVDWLARALPDPTGIAGEGTPAGVFDDLLEERVKRFQLRHNLLPDGIAGPKTLILLNGRLGTPGPRLTQRTMES
jgi:general secretion pathway protein A